MKSVKLVKGYRYFEAQEKGEEVLLIIRMHWLILSAPFLFGSIATISVAGFTYLVLKNSNGLINFDYADLIFRAAFSLVLLFGSLYAFSAWLTRFLNVLIVTNKHIIDVTQLTFFSRKISTLALDSIEDVAIDKKGIVANLFDYGNINIQTAGELPNFSIDHIGDPEAVQKAIMEAKEKFHGAPRPHGHSGVSSKGSAIEGNPSS